MAVINGVTTLTRFEVASPFLVSALLLFLAPFVAHAIEYRLRDVFTVFLEAPERPTLPGETEILARTAVWTIDAAQTITIFLGPLVGLVVVRPNLAGPLSLLYVVSLVVAIATFLGFTFKTDVNKYDYPWKLPLAGRRLPVLGWTLPFGEWRVKFFTRLVVVGILVNLIAGGLAWLIGP